MEFLEDIQSKPIFVGFFHGEFDPCAIGKVSSETVSIPPNVSIMQLTQPGEILTLSSSILYYLIHKKAFYTQVLMPLFAVEDPSNLLEHPNVEHIEWNMEDRMGHSLDTLLSAGEQLHSQEAPDALRIMKEATHHSPYTSESKTHFSRILRFMDGDQVPNLSLSSYDKNKHMGLGLYRYTPQTGKIDKIPLDRIHTPTLFEPLRLSHLLQFVGRTGGRLMLFSCSALDAMKSVRDAQKAQTLLHSQHESYKTRNPVFSPGRNWDLFIRAFPKIILPNLLFINGTTLKAQDYKLVQWALYNLITFVETYKNRSMTLRNQALTKRAPHGLILQNIGQNLGNEAPEPDESYISYMCRRTKQGCVLQGGKRTRRRSTKQCKTKTRKRN